MVDIPFSNLTSYSNGKHFLTQKTFITGASHSHSLKLTYLKPLDGIFSNFRINRTESFQTFAYIELAKFLDTKMIPILTKCSNRLALLRLSTNYLYHHWPKTFHEVSFRVGRPWNWFPPYHLQNTTVFS